MTGTSLDGLDVALVETTGRGWDLSVKLVSHRQADLDAVADALAELAGGTATRSVDVLRTARLLGAVHAEAVAALLSAAGLSAADVDFVVAHGQTVWHAPDEPGGGMSWQLLDPWPIVRQLGVAVCHDLRQADLVAGGQGAPITPASDLVIYGDRADAVVNLGGVCNVTVWSGAGTDGAATPSSQRVDLVRGGDVGPCNLLLDGLVQRLVPGAWYDVDGRRAAAGSVDDGAVAQIDTAVRAAIGTSRTLGRETFDAAWLDHLASEVRGWPVPVVLASAVEVVAGLLAAALAKRGATRVVLAGGGARNQALAAAIDRRCGDGMTVTLSDDLGVPCEAREAMAMAVLGALCDDGVPITLPAVTGATEPGVAGTWAGLEQRKDGR